MLVLPFVCNRKIVLRYSLNYSQITKLLSQIRKNLVTLSLNILRFLRLKVSLDVDLTYNIYNKIPIFVCNSFTNPA
jgi:hypothetical protein